MLVGIMDNEKTEVPTLTESITAQSTDSNCGAAFASVRKPNTRFSVDQDGVSVQVFSLDDGSEQVVPAAFHPGFFHLCRYSLLAGYLGERQMYGSMRKQLYWPRMANDPYNTVHVCRSCVQNRARGRKKSGLIWFP